MNRPPALLSALLAMMFAACSTTSTPRTEDAPELAKREKDLAAKAKERRHFQAVLMRLDQAMASYVAALANRGDPQADAQVKKFDKLLRDVVLDSGVHRIHNGEAEANRAPGEHYHRLRALAADGTLPDKQAIALAALGFSGRREVMPLIVQGAMLDDAFVVDRAVLGLAILRAPDTPPGVLAAIVEDAKHPETGRVQAAWALYRIQTASADHTDFVAIWRRFLGSERQRIPDGALVTAVRGLGLTGDDAHAELIAPLLKNPVPRIRMAAAVALGRMNAQDHWRELLELLKPQESVQNVRLHARKALAALAGNKDYGYDVSAWRNIFQRGQKEL